MTIIGTLGLISALCALFAFIANEYGYLKNEDVSYDLLNFLAGLGLVTYALSIHALPFVIVNGVWALVSGIDLYIYAKKRFKL
ncbi:MAG: hypothetical protein Q7S05_03855 [bacterium]|nr:hypothetical protein [bacterium]